MVIFHYYPILALDKNPSNDNYPIVETNIKSGASFCLAGNNTSFIFIGCDGPNGPNRRVEFSKRQILPIIESKPCTKEPEVSLLKKQNEKLLKENKEIRDEISKLKNENEEQIKKIAKLQEEDIENEKKNYF